MPGAKKPTRRVIDDDEDLPRAKRRPAAEEEDEEPPVRKRRKDDDDDDHESSGWSKLASKKKEDAVRKATMDNRPMDFYLKEDRESAIIQFLDDEPYCIDAHTVQIGKRPVILTCQMETQRHCLMCREGLKKHFKAVFKILDYRGNWDSEKEKYKFDEPVERMLLENSYLADQIKAFTDKKKKNLTELVVEITRVGTGTKTSYQLDRAEEDGDFLVPKKFKSKYGPTKECMKPLTDEELEATNYQKSKFE